MPALILYLLKVNIVLIIFYLAYRFALRRLTFYRLNRFFLISGIIFSSVYPFIDLSEVFKQHQELDNNKFIRIARDYSPVQRISERLYTPPVKIQAPAIRQPSLEISSLPPVDYWKILVGLFWTGVLLMTLRLFVQLFSLYRMHRHSKQVLFNKIAFRQISGKVNPFSFWRNIYLNPEQHTEEELKSILKHEQVHIEEWHTLDLLLAELNTIFYWFNPGVWLMKQAVRENLEFITDRKVLQNGLDSKTYQYNLVRISSLPQTYSLVSNFNFLSLKKRIFMMNKRHSPKVQVLRYLFLVPLVVLLSIAFTVSKAHSERKSLSQTAKFSIGKIVKSVSDITSGLSENVSKMIDNEDRTDEPLAIVDKQTLYVVDGVPLTSTNRVNGISVNSEGNVVSTNPYDIVSMDAVTDAAKLARYRAKYVILISTKPGKAGKVDISNSGNGSSPADPINVIIRAPTYSYSLWVVDGIPSNVDMEPSFTLSANGPAGTNQENQTRTYLVVKDLISGAIIKGDISNDDWEGYVQNNYPEHYHSRVHFLDSKSDLPQGMSVSNSGAITINSGTVTMSLFAGVSFLSSAVTDSRSWEVTPNNDGVNDKLVMNDLDKSANNMIWIFDYSFEKVFEQVNYSNDWNGKNLSGKDLPAGTYYVILREGKSKKIVRGRVELKR